MEAMVETQVTVVGNIHNIEKPFFVIATQNPIELEGTYMLPFSQMYRFFAIWYRAENNNKYVEKSYIL